MLLELHCCLAEPPQGNHRPTEPQKPCCFCSALVQAAASIFSQLSRFISRTRVLGKNTQIKPSNDLKNIQCQHVDDQCSIGNTACVCVCVHVGVRAGACAHIKGVVQSNIVSSRVTTVHASTKIILHFIQLSDVLEMNKYPKNQQKNSSSMLHRFGFDPLMFLHRATAKLDRFQQIKKLKEKRFLCYSTRACVFIYLFIFLWLSRRGGVANMRPCSCTNSTFRALESLQFFRVLLITGAGNHSALRWLQLFLVPVCARTAQKVFLSCARMVVWKMGNEELHEEIYMASITHTGNTLNAWRCDDCCHGNETLTTKKKDGRKKILRDHQFLLPSTKMVTLRCSPRCGWPWANSAGRLHSTISQILQQPNNFHWFKYFDSVLWAVSLALLSLASQDGGHLGQ